MRSTGELAVGELSCEQTARIKIVTLALVRIRNGTALVQ